MQISTSRKGPRTAGSNGTGNADHVARADPHGGAEKKGRQRRYAGLDTSLRGKRMDPCSEKPDLDKTKPESEIDTGTYEHDNG